MCVCLAIRYGRMPEAERKKLVAGLLAEELNLGKPGGSDLKTLAKQVNTAYLKNLSMTKKRARSILTGKTSSTSVHCTHQQQPGVTDIKIHKALMSHIIVSVSLENVIPATFIFIKRNMFLSPS